MIFVSCCHLGHVHVNYESLLRLLALLFCYRVCVTAAQNQKCGYQLKPEVQVFHPHDLSFHLHVGEFRQYSVLLLTTVLFLKCKENRKWGLHRTGKDSLGSKVGLHEVYIYSMMTTGLTQMNYCLELWKRFGAMQRRLWSWSKLAVFYN